MSSFINTSVKKAVPCCCKYCSHVILCALDRISLNSQTLVCMAASKLFTSCFWIFMKNVKISVNILALWCWMLLRERKSEQHVFRFEFMGRASRRGNDRAAQLAIMCACVCSGAWAAKVSSKRESGRRRLEARSEWGFGQQHAAHDDDDMRVSDSHIWSTHATIWSCGVCARVTLIIFFCALRPVIIRARVKVKRRLIY